MAATPAKDEEKTLGTTTTKNRRVVKIAFPEELGALLDARASAGLAAKHVPTAESKARLSELDAEVAKKAWLFVDAQSQGGDHGAASWSAATDDFGGVILDKYCEACACSLKKAPRALRAAAAASAALVGDDALAAQRLPADVRKLDSALRSKLIAVLCAGAAGRHDSFLDLALTLVDLEATRTKKGRTVTQVGQNPWLAQRGRRAFLDACVRRARTQSRRRRFDDDETALLSSYVATADNRQSAPTRRCNDANDDSDDEHLVNCYVVPPSERRLSDMLPADDDKAQMPKDTSSVGMQLLTYGGLVFAAENLARGAPRGRAKREALGAVAALAYLGEPDPDSAMDAVKKALRRATDGGGSSNGYAAPVLRAVLREALLQGDAATAEELLDELERRLRAKKKDPGLVWEDDASSVVAYDVETLDVVLACAADDGDASGAAAAFLARSARQIEHHDVLGGPVTQVVASLRLEDLNATAKHDRALAQALRACVPDVAAGNDLDAVAGPLLSQFSFSNHQRSALFSLESTALSRSRSREVRLARVELLAAHYAALQLRDELWPLVHEARARDGSRGLVAALGGCEAVVKATDDEFERCLPNDSLDDSCVSEAAQLASRLVTRYYSHQKATVSAAVVDAAMRVFAAAGATRLALDLALRRRRDANARYGALRCCALSPRPDALPGLLKRLDDDDDDTGSRGGAWSRLAVAVARARAGAPEEAVLLWRSLHADFAGQLWVTRTALSTTLAALVSHPRGALAAAKLVEDIDEQGLGAFRAEDDDESSSSSSAKYFAEAFGVKPLRKRKLTEEKHYEAQGHRVRAALARRLGNARNWAAATKNRGENVVVGETSYARLAAALVRSREARDAREAVELLSRYGVRIERMLQCYFERAEPRRNDLRKALFRSDAVDAAAAERWYDSRPDRAGPQIDPKRNRKRARDVVTDVVLPSAVVVSSTTVEQQQQQQQQQSAAASS